MIERLGVYLVYDATQCWAVNSQDPGSDVDFGDEAMAADAGPTGATTVSPCLKRRRLHRKTPPTTFVPANALAVVPEKMEPTHLSRSLQVDVFCVDFGTRTRKPDWLVPLTVEGVATTERPCLRALSGKESGNVYFASKPLANSLAAMLVLQASASVQEAYSRLPLLLSPSRHQAFPRDLATTLVEDVYNGEDATTDGASDIGWRDAVRLNLLDISSDKKHLLYAPVQFRGFFRLRQDLYVLGKGMLMVDPTREHGLHLRRSCRKLELVNAASATEVLGLDITAETWAAMQPPRINCQVTAALAMRALCGQTAGACEAAMGLLEALCLVGGVLCGSTRSVL